MAIQPTRIASADFAGAVGNLLQQFQIADRRRKENEEIERLAAQREAVGASLPGAVAGQAGSLEQLLAADPRLGLAVQGQRQGQSNADRLFNRLLSRDTTQAQQVAAQAAESKRRFGVTTGLQQRSIAATAALRDEQAKFRKLQFQALQDQRKATNALAKERNVIAGQKALIPKPATADQAKSSGFARRTLSADKILSEPAMIAAATNIKESAKSGVPLIGNALISKNRRRFEQAQRNFVNAVLRRESGAAIAPHEFESAAKQYFPQTFDDVATIAQKAQNRREAIQGLVESSGPLSGQFGGSVQAAPQSTVQEGATATNPQTGQKIIFQGGQWAPAQ
ncbi:MAG: hypothetical protein GY952_06785 [Rhodobacteraceae bacterium]|nr:hypothetical protein [Paracoccaceae bacterium]